MLMGVIERSFRSLCFFFSGWGGAETFLCWLEGFSDAPFGFAAERDGKGSLRRSVMEGKRGVKGSRKGFRLKKA
jgi:hypothetical protein